MTTDSSFCQQRYLTQLYNIPPNRITPENPYVSGNFTKYQLDMRRKVEILKYSANKSSTKTNNITKKGQFALLARGGLSRSTANIPANAPSCEADDAIPTPTSSCDVPGPVTYLKYESNVPLYNYSNFNTRPYSELTQSYNGPWQFVVLSNVIIYDNGKNTIDYLIINNTISKPMFTYSITIPFSISVTGTIPPYNPINPAFTGNVNILLTDAILEIYFNAGNLVKSINLNNLSNLNVVINIPRNTTSSAKSFHINQFIGNLLFPNITLFTVSSYVYTFILTAKLDISQNNTGLFNSIAIVANATSVVSEAVGCTIVSSHNAVNLGSSINGV